MVLALFISNSAFAEIRYEVTFPNNEIKTFKVVDKGLPIKVINSAFCTVSKSPGIDPKDAEGADVICMSAGAVMIDTRFACFNLSAFDLKEQTSALINRSFIIGITGQKKGTKKSERALITMKCVK